MTLPTQAQLMLELDYNPKTGLFSWARHQKFGASAGDSAGYVNAGGYVCIWFKGREYKAHRLAVVYMDGSIPDGMHVDHINGDRADNRASNLRVVAPAQNAQNQRRPQRNNKCGLMGVSAYRDKWKAQISNRGRVIYLGLYKTPEAAHERYIAAKRELHALCTI